MSSRASMALSPSMPYIIIHCCLFYNPIERDYYKQYFTVEHDFYKLTTNCCVVTIIARFKLEDSYSK